MGIYGYSPHFGHARPKVEPAECIAADEVEVEADVKRGHAHTDGHRLVHEYGAWGCYKEGVRKVLPVLPSMQAGSIGGGERIGQRGGGSGARPNVTFHFFHE